jgi:hypothetical protein
MAIPREPDKLSSNGNLDGLRRDYTPAPQISKAYLLGLLHDATQARTTYRIASKSKLFCNSLKKGMARQEIRSWVYQEGKLRNVWILEFSKKHLKDFEVKSVQDKIDYIRGYFDAEGGIAKDPDVRFYLYFAQKDKQDLLQVRDYLQEIGISCGKMHNPSNKVDPNYFRFFISAKSYGDFARIVSSFHPEKQLILRMKI